MSKKMGRPTKQFNVLESNIMRQLYYLGPLTKTEIKRTIYPRNTTGRGCPRIDEELKWLEKNGFVRLDRFERKMIKSEKVRLLLNKKTRGISIDKKHKPYLWMVPTSFEKKEAVVFKEAKLSGIQERYIPDKKWIENYVGCQKKNAKILHELLLNWPRYVFRRAVGGINDVLRVLLTDLLALRTVEEINPMWKGLISLPDDKIIYQLLRDNEIYTFLGRGTYYERIILDSAIVVIEKDLGIYPKKSNF